MTYDEDEDRDLPPPAPAAVATCESFERQHQKREAERARAPRGRPVWSGSGSLPPDAEAASARPDRDHSGIVLACDRGDGVRLRVAILMHEGRPIFDVREERWTGTTWAWTHRGIQLGAIEVREVLGALERAVEDVCIP